MSILILLSMLIIERSAQIDTCMKDLILLKIPTLYPPWSCDRYFSPPSTLTRCCLFSLPSYWLGHTIMLDCNNVMNKTYKKDNSLDISSIHVCIVLNVASTLQSWYRLSYLSFAPSSLISCSNHLIRSLCVSIVDLEVTKPTLNLPTSVLCFSFWVANECIRLSLV